MTIGIVLHPYGEDKPGGLPRVIFEWTQALLERDKENEYIIYLKKRPKTPPVLPGKWKLEILGGNPFLWLNRLRRVREADVYIFNTPVLPLFFRPKKSILVVYDFPYLYLPARDLWDFLRRIFINWYHNFSLRRADGIAAVSESAKKDVMRFFGVPERKITVVYHGFKNICEIEPKGIELPKKFFFFVGTLKERKNVINIVEAFSLLKKSHPELPHKLVLGGKSEGKYYERLQDLVRKKGLEGEIVFAGYLNDSELSHAYRRAEALVFPSLVEATGNPILEAMACGLPVITSNIFGPAELAGEAGILVNPESPEEIARAMWRIVGDKEYRDILVRRGLEQVKKFSWDNLVPKMLALINSL